MPPSRKKLAAKKRLKNQVRDPNTGQFIEQYSTSDGEYILSSDDYSSDSSDESYYAQRILKLGDISFNLTEIDEKKKASYTGNSTASYYRKYGPSGTFTKAAKGSLPINQYFATISSDLQKEILINEIETNADSINDISQMNSSESLQEIIYTNTDDILQLEDFESAQEETDIEDNIIEDILLQKIKDLELFLDQDKRKITAYDYLKYRSIYEFLINWKKKNMSRDNAAFNAAQKVFDKGVYCARSIKKWAKYWLENNTIPTSMQGCHQKTKSFIDDEDIINDSLTFIRENSGKIIPKNFQQFINSKLLSKMDEKKSITLKTARIWLKKLGLTPQSKKKGIYFDGHERDDVVEYRKKFLEEIEKYEQYMPTFVGDEMTQLNPETPPGQQLHLFITHDECLFYANDDRPIVWAPIGEPPLRKKGQGKSIMVSDFLLETIGRLKLTPEQSVLNPNIPVEARKFLKPGKNEEGWWTADHLIDQVINYAIPIFETIYPDAIAVMAFDNSTNHGAMPEDGLNVTKMNVNPGGKQPKMHSTFFGANNTPQSMVFPSDHSQYPNEAKGMRQILIERGLWKEGLMGECKLCKKKGKKIDSQRVDCCMRRILSLQLDFISQKSRLQIEIEKRGHKCIFYPKFHCELNFIEMYWGAAKHYTREHCNYSWTGLQRIVPEALDSIPLITIRRFAQKSWRYMNIYRKGITGKMAEFAAKKYKSHRRVPDSIYNELDSFILNK